MQTLLEQLCKSIDREAQLIVSTVNVKSPFHSDVFDAPIEVENATECEYSLRGRKGVYIFVVRHALSLKHEQVLCWNNEVRGGKFKEYKAVDINDGDCLYLGSCVSKSLYSRIKEHFSIGGSYQALKLGHQARQVLFREVYCIAFPIKQKYSEQQYRILLPNIERKLHELLAPLCGSSRT